MLHLSNNLKEKKRNINNDLAVLPSHDKIAERLDEDNVLESETTEDCHLCLQSGKRLKTQS